MAHEGIVLLFGGELEQFGRCGRLFEFAEGDGGMEADARDVGGEQWEERFAVCGHVTEHFGGLGEDFGIGVGEECRECAGFDFFGTQTLSEPPDGVDAGELFCLLVSGDGCEGGEVCLFDHGELSVEADSLVWVGEMRRMGRRGGEELGRFEALGAVLAGGIVGSPDVADFIERITAAPVGHDE